MAHPQLGPKIATVYELQSAWLEPKLREQDVTWATFQLLTTIAGLGAQASQVEVASGLGVTPSTLSESVQAHIKRGLIDQVPSTADRRVKVLRLTASAHSKLDSIRKVASSIEQTLVQGLSVRDVEVCAKILDQVAKKLVAAIDAESTPK